MKVVLNGCYGGFSLSEAALKLGREMTGNPNWGKFGGFHGDLERADPALVAVVERLGDAASGDFAQLRVEDIAPGSRWRIDEYDGNECVLNADDYEWSVAT